MATNGANFIGTNMVNIPSVRMKRWAILKTTSTVRIVYRHLMVTMLNFLVRNWFEMHSCRPTNLN